MTYILGISSFYHDSAAALIKDGKIVSAVQEERFTRIKHDSKFPRNAIMYILSENSISLNDIDYIVFYEKPFLKFERILETFIAFAPSAIKSFCFSMPIWLREKLFQKKLIFDELKKIDSNFNSYNKIKFSKHHLSHAASAYFPSPFDEAIILTIDGVGEWATTTCSIGKGNNIEFKKEILFPHSLGLFYSAFTYYLGFKVNSGEYKVMGLAPYGKPIYKDLIYQNLIDVKSDGSFRLNLKFFDYTTGLTMINDKFVNLFCRPRRKPESESLTQFHMDVAASVQAVIEEIILRLVISLKKEYQIENLCLAGGVALNCVANGKIMENKIFKNVWVQPAAGDAGGSLGASLAYWYQTLKNNRIASKNSMNGSYLGPEYSNQDIKSFLIQNDYIFQEFEEDNMLNLIAKHLSEGKIIGWFQGKMEFGPRSLGNRSIIADPRPSEMQKKVNLKIKYRESFRPFAPSILYERLNDFFELDCESPYMLLVSKIKKKFRINVKDDYLFGIEKLNQKRSTLPAITHLDYSSRIQTVHKDTNPKFHELINRFEKITKYPILLNTSFNIRGEPIVNSPKDAYKCFMGTDLDILVLENFVLYKTDQTKSKETSNYQGNFNLD